MALRTGGTLARNVMTSRRLLIQGGPVGIGRIAIHRKVLRLGTAGRAAATVGASGNAQLTGPRFGIGGRLIAARFGIGRGLVGVRIHTLK